MSLKHISKRLTLVLSSSKVGYHLFTKLKKSTFRVPKHVAVNIEYNTGPRTEPWVTPKRKGWVIKKVLFL